jgi:hypothetical protein
MPSVGQLLKDVRGIAGTPRTKQKPSHLMRDPVVTVPRSGSLFGAALLAASMFGCADNGPLAPDPEGGRALGSAVFHEQPITVEEIRSLLRESEAELIAAQKELSALFEAYRDWAHSSRDPARFEKSGTVAVEDRLRQPVLLAAQRVVDQVTRSRAKADRATALLREWRLRNPGQYAFCENDDVAVTNCWTGSFEVSQAMATLECDGEEGCISEGLALMATGIAISAGILAASLTCTPATTNACGAAAGALSSAAGAWVSAMDDWIHRCGIPWILDLAASFCDVPLDPTEVYSWWPEWLPGAEQVIAYLEW